MLRENLLVGSLLVVTCLAAAPTDWPRPGGRPVDWPGLHNVVHVLGELYSGGGPDGDVGFESLKKLGIKTIISVDGARPDVERARKLGMRYVHVPIGYDGVRQDQATRLARAVRDLPGPIYLHCHHGKHRSPAAAAAILYCLDECCTVSQAVEVMKRAGTDPRYQGLYAAPAELRRPSRAELDRAGGDFPEIAKVPALAEAMVRIDQRWENLLLLHKARWKTPPTHPDLEAPHEALQLWEHYRELGRDADMQKRPEDFRAWLRQGEEAAGELEKALRGPQTDKNAAAAEQAFLRSRTLCSQCHATYRDVPQRAKER